MDETSLPTPKDIKIAAARHDIDARTLMKALQGGTVRPGLTAERVKRALQELQASTSTTSVLAPANAANATPVPAPATGGRS